MVASQEPAPPPASPQPPAGSKQFDVAIIRSAYTSRPNAYLTLDTPRTVEPLLSPMTCPLVSTGGRGTINGSVEPPSEARRRAASCARNGYPLHHRKSLGDAGAKGITTATAANHSPTDQLADRLKDQTTSSISIEIPSFAASEVEKEGEPKDDAVQPESIPSIPELSLTPVNQPLAAKGHVPWLSGSRSERGQLVGCDKLETERITDGIEGGSSTHNRLLREMSGEENLVRMMIPQQRGAQPGNNKPKPLHFPVLDRFQTDPASVGRAGGTATTNTKEKKLGCLANKSTWPAQQPSPQACSLSAAVDIPTHQSSRRSRGMRSRVDIPITNEGDELQATSPPSKRFAGSGDESRRLRVPHHNAVHATREKQSGERGLYHCPLPIHSSSDPPAIEVDVCEKLRFQEMQLELYVGFLGCQIVAIYSGFIFGSSAGGFLQLFGLLAACYSHVDRHTSSYVLTAVIFCISSCVLGVALRYNVEGFQAYKDEPILHAITIGSLVLGILFVLHNVSLAWQYRRGGSVRVSKDYWKS